MTVASATPTGNSHSSAIHTTTADKGPVFFDDFGKLRILDSHYFEQSEKLKDECNDFSKSTDF